MPLSAENSARRHLFKTFFDPKERPHDHRCRSHVPDDEVTESWMAHARDQRREAELSFDPYRISEPVDPSEVPEVHRFFRAKRSWMNRLAVVATVITLVLGVGLASAIADAYFIPVQRDAAQPDATASAPLATPRP